MTQTVWVDEVTARLGSLVKDNGVFLRREVIALGLEDRDLRRQLRRGAWVRVRHGAYTFADLWAAADPAERHRMRTRAAVRVLGERVVVSHQSACLLHRMALWAADLDLVHVTRTDGGAGRWEGDVRHHEGLLLDQDVRTVGGVAVTHPARAALEAASLMSVEQGLVVVDSGLHQGLFDGADLTAQQLLMQSWPASQHLQLVARLGDGRSESPGESRTRYLCWAHGLPAPELQYEVWSAGVLVGVCDFAWPAHGLLGEFDGKEKYSKHLRPGESPADAVFREKKREDALRHATGWRVVRLTWHDLMHPDRTVAMLRAALAG